MPPVIQKSQAAILLARRVGTGRSTGGQEVKHAPPPMAAAHSPSGGVAWCLVAGGRPGAGCVCCPPLTCPRPVRCRPVHVHVHGGSRSTGALPRAWCGVASCLPEPEGFPARQENRLHGTGRSNVQAPSPLLGSGGGVSMSCVYARRRPVFGLLLCLGSFGRFGASGQRDGEVDACARVILAEVAEVREVVRPAAHGQADGCRSAFRVGGRTAARAWVCQLAVGWEREGWTGGRRGGGKGTAGWAQRGGAHRQARSFSFSCVAAWAVRLTGARAAYWRWSAARRLRRLLGCGCWCWARSWRGALLPSCFATIQPFDRRRSRPGACGGRWSARAGSPAD